LTRRDAAKAKGRLEGNDLALFDLDRTLIPGSCLVPLGRALLDAGHVRRTAVLTAALRNASFARRGATDNRVARLREGLLSAVAGLERAPLIEICGTIADEVVDGMYSGGRWLVERHRAAGDFCVLLSSSPQELVEAVGQRIGVHRAVGTSAETQDGRFTGRLKGAFCYGPGKLDRLRHELGAVDLTLAHAYADSASDTPLLSASGWPVAVNPDRRLKATAREAGWPIMRLE